MDIVTKALQYYDENSEKYSSLLSKIKYKKFNDHTGDMERNVVILCDKNKKEIFRSRYEMLGYYDPKIKIWLWAWAKPTFSKNQTYISRKLFAYGADLDPKHNLYIKAELITSRFIISSHVQLDVHIAISAYLSKMPLIFITTPTSEDEEGYYAHHDINKPINGRRGMAERNYMFLLDYEKL